MPVVPHGTPPSQVLKRLLEDSTVFTSQLNTHSISVTGGEDDWHSIDSSYVTIEWELDLDMREWGVKSIGVNIRKVHLVLEWRNPRTNQEQELEINWPSKKGNRPPSEQIKTTLLYLAEPDYTVEVSEVSFKAGMLYPVELEIDLDKRIITIGFF